MSISTDKFMRKTFTVDAIQVTEENMEEVAAWCHGSIKDKDGRKYVDVRVHRPLNDRQSQAFVNDWILFANKGYKVYTPKAFENCFDPVFQESVDVKASGEEKPVRTVNVVNVTRPPIVDPTLMRELAMRKNRRP